MLNKKINKGCFDVQMLFFFYYDGLSGIGYYVCQNNQQSVTQM